MSGFQQAPLRWALAGCPKWNAPGVQNARRLKAIPSLSPPETHRRFDFNLRCVSGGDREG
jgi:hypothetical protein